MRLRSVKTRVFTSLERVSVTVFELTISDLRVGIAMAVRPVRIVLIAACFLVTIKVIPTLLLLAASDLGRSRFHAARAEILPIGVDTLADDNGRPAEAKSEELHQTCRQRMYETVKSQNNPEREYPVYLACWLSEDEQRFCDANTRKRAAAYIVGYYKHFFSGADETAKLEPRRSSFGMIVRKNEEPEPRADGIVLEQIQRLATLGYMSLDELGGRKAPGPVRDALKAYPRVSADCR
jgi:hypothetical protein